MLPNAIKIVILSICLIIPFISMAQAPDPNKKDAKSYFATEDYKNALPEYLKLLKTDSLNVENRLNTGICYLKTNIDKSKAIPYLESVTKKGKVNPIAYLHLANAYRLNYRFEDAINAFTDYIAKANLKKEDLDMVKHQMECCKNAQELTKLPARVIIENLGEEINSPAKDFNPFVPEDEDLLLFSSKRSGSVGGILDLDGSFLSDIYFSKVKNSNFTKAKGIGGKINTPNNDKIVDLSANGDYMIISTDNTVGIEDLYLSVAKGKTFTAPVILPNTINTISFKSAAGINNDGDVIFVSRDSNTGNGNDLFMQRKLPNNEWGEMVNLGPNINTKYDEDYPHISANGKTLYFCSQGHNSIGGFDLFYSNWDEQKGEWGKAINFGYPINTPDDEMNISISKSGKYGYLSGFRDPSFGDLDIYRAIFLDKDPLLSVVRGHVYGTDSINIFKKHDELTPKDFKIIITNVKTKKVFGNYRPEKKSGKYTLILPADETFEISLEVNGFDKYQEQIMVGGKSNYRPEFSKDIILYTEGTSPKKEITDQPAKTSTKGSKKKK